MFELDHIFDHRSLVVGKPALDDRVRSALMLDEESMRFVRALVVWTPDPLVAIVDAISPTTEWWWD
jgi:hypothetical protein